MRKHLKNKRLESLTQLGMDRIIDMQFGSGEAAYHVILELYDRGNVILTDYELTILNVLRPHAEGDKVKFVVKEKYPQNRARENDTLNNQSITHILNKAKPTDQLKKVLVANSGKSCQNVSCILGTYNFFFKLLDYGPAVIEHVLLNIGFTSSTKVGKDVKIPDDIDKIVEAMNEAQKIMDKAKIEHSKVTNGGFVLFFWIALLLKRISI